MSPEALPAFIPPRVLPVPTEMLATLAAPDVRVRLVAAIVAAAIVNAAIVPPVAVRADVVIVPVIVADVATITPASVILNGAVALFVNVSPAQNLTSSPAVTVEARPKLLATSLM